MKAAIAVIAIIVLAVVVWWKVSFPSGSWRYKMTVTVETPEGIKTGSAVREISAYSMPMFLGVNRHTHIKLEKGEAVVVDLGERGALFVLMSLGGGAGQAIGAPFNAFPSPCSRGAISRCSIKYYTNLKNTGKAELKPRFYPGMVYFKNRYDPQTVERVVEMKACPDPETGFNSHCIKADHFERVFGEGVRLKSITVEMTKEETVWTISGFLPWLKNIEAYIDGQRYGGGPELSNILNKGDFIVGETQ
ncbi:MAG TPA: hypothetical protein PLX33_02095 [Alphaproteobacteria bacterium]|nr:hypothetical protein [Alphaproteobacteria bacterium]